jgi:hypothetical protein
MVEALDDFNGDVVCYRDEDGSAVSNVPRRITKHSPDGFEWGYGGSGPADFALNILSVFIGEKLARKNGLYQNFKWKFVSTLPGEGGIIKHDDIREWLRVNMDDESNVTL